MSFYDDYGIGDALQYFGADDYPMPTNLQAYLGSGDQEGDYPMPTTPQAYLGSGDQEGDYPMPTNAQTPGAFGGTPLSRLLAQLKAGGGAGSLLGKGLDLASSRGGLAAIMALLSALDRQKAGGGGTKLAYQGPRQYTRTVAPGAGGTPIARFAANGGLMQAYAGGGQVQMEDGGFVMTKKAVDGAGGPGGIQQLVPGARMIRGPGHGTSDSIPAVINGRNGQTPARLSNGEAYVPPGHDTKKLYALMHSLERKA